jgi:excisionase family DNA binding protein
MKVELTLPQQPPLLYKPEGAAAELGVGRTKVYELIAAGELESITIGRARRIPADSIRAYVERLRAAQSPVEATSGT